MGRQVLAISIGDPAGIGPELICKAWTRRAREDLPEFFVVGGANVLAAAAETLGETCPIVRIENPALAERAFARGLPVLGSLDAPFRPARPGPQGAALALESLELGCKLARDGAVGGLVTAPVAKRELAKIGFEYPGQTEFLAARCALGADDAVMMLAGPSLRTIPLTVHVALAEVPALISQRLIVQKARIAAAALARDFGIAEPLIAIAALNPHAGEAGRFGDEEERIIAPAIAELRASGVDASGPHPADALFAPRARANFDVALCMYHDQALIPVKALDFDSGVNVTLGLPIIRTSPDHGTAFDIAGKNLAEPGAMIAAIRMAGEMAAHRAHG